MRSQILTSHVHTNTCWRKLESGEGVGWFVLGMGYLRCGVCVQMKSKFLSSNHPKNFDSLTHSLVSPAHGKTNIAFSCAYKPQIITFLVHINPCWRKLETGKGLGDWVWVGAFALLGVVCTLEFIF